MKTYFKLFPILFLFSTHAFGQNWVEKKNDPNENFYSIKQEFDNYWSNKTYERGKGYKAFKRWEWFSEPRVYPSGNMEFASKSKAQEEFQNYLLQNPTFAQKISAPVGVASTSGNWTAMGPYGSPIGGDAGRITFIRFVPGNVNRFFIGTGAGGLWETTDGGVTWNTSTNNLAVLGCSDLAIDPTNTNIMYLATGDIDSGDTYSTGILKSIDGGVTWVSTGLNWAVTNQRRIGRLLINPTNPNILLAATSAGIYRTTNAGTTWVVVKTGNYQDIEFKSGDLTNVFAVTPSTFVRSVDGGATFTTTSTGLPASGVNRMALSVTPADANYIYILCSSSSDNGFYGLYRSINGGVSFTQMSSSPNIFGWQPDASDVGGQGWYDIACGVSPTNKDELICGGVNSWKSMDGGTTWAINSHWYGAGGNPYVHADLHTVEYLNGTTCYMGTDGGIARTTNSGTSWTTINGLMNIAQVTRIGNSATTSNYVISGHQDNGTNLLNGATWTEVYGGDGSDCFVDWSGNSTLIASYIQGDFQKSTNGGVSFSPIQTGLTGTGAWIAPIIQSPNNANIFYCGYQQVFTSANKGGNWTQMGTLGGSGTILYLAAAPSNTNVLYAARSTSIYKTIDNGVTWTSISTGLPTGSAQITRIAVDNTDANNIFVSFSGYSSTNKVFSSTNGGTSWTNISTGLPNLPVNCITYYNNSNDDIYIGTDVGVYFRNASMTSWVPFMTGLPNVIVNDIDPFYPAGKIRAGTYGRGVWQSDKYSNSTLDIGIVNIIDPANTSASCNTGVTPKITINNLGTSTVTTAVIMYKMDATATQTLNWTGALVTSASTVVTLNTYSGLTAAAHTFSVWIGSPNAGVDQDLSNNTQLSTFTVISAPVSVSLPLVEGFENAIFPPTNWALQKNNTIDPAVSWTRVLNSTGLAAGSTANARMDNYSSTLDVSGQLDALRTPALNFSGANSSLSVQFDVSHKNYSATDIDTLNVKISTDCGGSWTQLYTKGGTQLATVTGTQTTAFTPTANAQWRRETISLTAYTGLPSVYLKFESRSGWGNHLYLDNINISYTTTASPSASFTSSSLKCSGSPITFNDQSTNSPTSWAWSFPGGTPASSTAQNPSITYSASGTYTVTLQSANINGTSIAVTQTITVNTKPSVTVSNATVCSGVSTILSATGANTYLWNTGASTSSISVMPSTSINYTVTGTNTLGCSDTKTVSVTVKSSPTIAVNNATICSGNSVNLSASGANTYSWSTGASTASISVTPTTSTNYTVAGTNTLGCTTAKTVSVTVISTTMAVNNATICSGDATVLTASGSTSYTWSSGETTAAISVTLTLSANYTVTGTTSGCANTKTVSVFVNQLPFVTLGAISSPICINNPTIALSGNPAGGIYSGTGVSGNTFDPLISGAGTFTILYQYTDGNNCSNFANQSVIVDLCTGINEVAGKMISLFPNPVNDIITVVLDPSLALNAHIQIYDARGRLVLTENVISNQTVININSLTNGIYTLRVVSVGNQFSKRFVKE
ncbi:MAG: T9SS type A sorting domain-containing protein [Burkholderiales bacterium]|nr:T9SS type A sorting domain-containing protein [Bacteroidia bacterium]